MVVLVEVRFVVVGGANPPQTPFAKGDATRAFPASRASTQGTSANQPTRLRYPVHTQRGQLLGMALYADAQCEQGVRVGG